MPPKSRLFAFRQSLFAKAQSDNWYRPSVYLRQGRTVSEWRVTSAWLPCACGIWGVKKNRGKSGAAFPFWEGRFTTEARSARKKGGRKAKTTADCAEDADRILYVRFACGCSTPSRAKPARAGDPGCAQAVGRMEWVVVNRSPSDESLGFLLASPRRGTHAQRLGRATGPSQKKDALNTLERGEDCC